MPRLTTHAERKRLLGLLIEDATLTRYGYQVRVDLRLRGGRVHTLPLVTLPKAPADARRHEISQEVRAELKALLKAGFHDKQAAEELNRRGFRDSKGEPFFRDRIAKIRVRLNIPSCPDFRRATLRNKGYVTAVELAATLQMTEQQVYYRACKGRGIERRPFMVGKRRFCMYKATSEGALEPQQQAQLP